MERWFCFCFFKELCIENLKGQEKTPKIGSLEHFQQPNHQSIIKNVVRLLSLADVPSRWKCSNSYLGSRSYPCSCSLQYLQLGRWPVLGKGYGLFVLQGVFSEGQNGVWGILWKMWADMLIFFFYPMIILFWKTWIMRYIYHKLRDIETLIKPFLLRLPLGVAVAEQP